MFSISQSTCVINKYNLICGRLLKLRVQQTLGCVLHIHSPASVELFFCSSAFTSCLVCESAGLHFILVFLGMFAAASGGHLFGNMLVCHKLFDGLFVFFVFFVVFFKRKALCFQLMTSRNLNRTPTQKMKKFVFNSEKCIYILST